MTRLFVIGLASLSLAACAPRYAPVKSTPPPADVPDAALVSPCDRANGDPETNAALALETAHTRKQRDDCADRMDGIRQWRDDALRRASIVPAATLTPAKGPL